MLHLKRIPMLAGLPSTEIAVLAEAAGERVLRRGEIVLREGEPVGSVHFVVRGSLLVTRRGQRTGTVGPGAGVGGLGLFARDPLGSQVAAEEDTLTLELEADAVFEVLEDRFPILHHILRETSARAIDLVNRFRLDPAAGVPECDLVGLGRDEFDLVDRIFFLRRQAVFRRSSITALADLARSMAQVRFDPGTTLWREGEPAPGIFLLGHGFVRATSSRGLDFRPGPGFALGALEAVAERPRFYTATTDTDVVALQGAMGGLADAFEDNFDMAMDYLAVVSQSVLRMLDWTAARGEPNPLGG
jgi:CRP-like cAMP-binding protein